GSNQAPVAHASASPLAGKTPLVVNFNGSTSSDPDGQSLTYSWDLNGDGLFGDSVAIAPTFTYTTSGRYTVRLRVTDSQGASDTDQVVVDARASTPPVPTILTPSAGTTWKVGDVVNFSGSAQDTEDGTLPASRLSWSLVMHHCPSNCHTHPV